MTKEKRPTPAQIFWRAATVIGIAVGGYFGKKFIASQPRNGEVEAIAEPRVGTDPPKKEPEVPAQETEWATKEGVLFPIIEDPNDIVLRGTVERGGKGYHCGVNGSICGWDYWTENKGMPELVAGIDGVIETGGIDENGEPITDTYGNPILVIKGDNGIKVTYLHMDSVSVENGQRVERGQKIGVVGNKHENNSDWSHLHFSIQLSDGTFDEKQEWLQVSGGNQTEDVRGVEGEERTDILPTPDFKTMFESTKMKEDIVDEVAKFITLEPRDTGRAEAENGLCQLIENRLNDGEAEVGDVLLAWQAMATINGRAWMSQLFWNMTQEGKLEKYGVPIMSDELIVWALENEIDPRVLSITRMTWNAAREIFEANLDSYLEAVPKGERQNNMEMRLPNPGIVAKLIMTETGHWSQTPVEWVINGEVYYLSTYGYANIGDGFAWNEIVITPDLFPSGHGDLTWIAEHMARTTGLPFEENEDTHTIAGSRKISDESVTNLSGGAIGVQFMPINAKLAILRFIDANSKLGNKYPDPSPLDPVTATVMATLFVAGESFIRHGSVDGVTTVVKPGYWTEDDEAMYYSMMGWNDHDPQIKEVLDAGRSYYSQFGRPAENNKTGAIFPSYKDYYRLALNKGLTPISTRDWKEYVTLVAGGVVPLMTDSLRNRRVIASTAKARLGIDIRNVGNLTPAGFMALNAWFFYKGRETSPNLWRKASNDMVFVRLLAKASGFKPSVVEEALMAGYSPKEICKGVLPSINV